MVSEMDPTETFRLAHHPQMHTQQKLTHTHTHTHTHTQTGCPDLVQGLHYAHHVVEDDDGLPLAQPLLLDDVVLQVYELRRLVAEVVRAQAVQHQADALLHALPPASLALLQVLIRPVLNRQTDRQTDR